MRTIPRLLVLVSLCGGEAAAEVRASASGHYVWYAGKTLLLVGDSGTQCVLQDLNLDYRHWLDDCADCGLKAVHVWSVLAPRQKRDGSVVEARYGYVYPGVTPWRRRESGPPAMDGWAKWDLTRFDEGADPDRHYWPRLRDLCRRAKERGMIVGITVFFGWPKHDTTRRPDWSYHPFNVLNGGFLVDPRADARGITAVQTILSPGTEVFRQPWSDAWPPAKKTQWVWERFAAKLIAETNPFGNVFFVFMDEHSYSEGNCGDHFRRFFRSRGAAWCDWEGRRKQVTFVYSPTVTTPDKHALAVRGFRRQPHRPFLHLEGGPYQGRGMRTALWTCLTGGGHYFFHDDAGQETPQTGIMGYDPHVVGGNTGMIRRKWLGYASRFFNEQVRFLDALTPHDELVVAGQATCLAAPAKGEFAVYLPHGGKTILRLPPRRFRARWYDPRTGTFTAFVDLAGGPQSGVTPPTVDDWVLHLQALPG